jgi:protein gp37
VSTIISWTDETWNPTTGCSRISEGCRHCYAERLSLKFGWSKKPWTAANSKLNVIEHHNRLAKVKTFKPGSRVFVNSMSDLFHAEVSDAFIQQVFDAMASRPDVVFQVLTKRPERAAEWPGPWPANVWMGTSVEDQRVAHRVETLARSGAAVKFLSVEPMIGALEANFGLVDWVIVGGESGPGFRTMDHAWARGVRDQCLASGTAFFFKQSSAFATERGVALDHGDGTFWVWHQFPGDLREPYQVPRQMDARALAVWCQANGVSI